MEQTTIEKVEQIREMLNDLTPVELRAIAKAAYAVAELKGRQSLYRGCRVAWKSEKYGRMFAGKVTFLNEKTVSVVADDGGKWRIPWSMLEVVKNGGPVGRPAILNEEFEQ